MCILQLQFGVRFCTFFFSALLHCLNSISKFLFTIIRNRLHCPRSKSFCKILVFTSYLLFHTYFILSTNHLSYSMQLLTYFHSKKVTRSLGHLHFDFNVRKKRKVYNILIINNLYINIYFFCFQFIESDQWPSDFSQAITFSVLILNILCTLKGHFFGSLLSNTVTFCLGSSAHFPHFFALNR